MHKICLIRQPAGLGDIFFCQKIACHYATVFNQVIWPVKKDFIYVKNYLKCPLPVEFVVEEFEFPFKNLLYLNPCIDSITDEAKGALFVPLHGHKLLDPSVMKSKYKLVGLDWSDWSDFFHFERNKLKENELFYDVLGLKDGEEFSFLNEQFASPPNVEIRHIDFQVPKDHKVVNLQIHPDFTIFDWCKVLENAMHIVTVETCLNYIIEKLNVKAKKLVMISKWNPPDFHHIEGLFAKPWIYIK